MTKTIRGTALAFVGLMTLAAATSAQAVILVDQPQPYGGYYAGGYDWTQFSASLAAQPGGYVAGSIGNAAQVAAADAILITARSNFVDATTPFLSATEIANLTSFLATGKRVVIVGEGAASFDQWTQSIVAFASGGAASVTMGVVGSTSPIVANALTAGVGTVNMQGVGTVSGGGGTALFGQNFATLWGDNLLTILDVNVLQDNPSPPFRNNVANWLGASQGAVPEPASWALMIAGFAIAGAAMRRSAAVRTSLRFA